MFDYSALFDVNLWKLFRLLVTLGIIFGSFYTIERIADDIIEVVAPRKK